MGLYYHAEYRIGPRGGRVCRSYSGFRAFLAILFDLVFGTFFDVVAAVFALARRVLFLNFHVAGQLLRLAWRMLIFVMTALAHLLALPHRVMHADLGALWRDMVPIDMRMFARRVMSATFDSPIWRRWRDWINTRRAHVTKPDWGLGQEV